MSSSAGFVIMDHYCEARGCLPCKSSLLKLRRSFFCRVILESWFVQESIMVLKLALPLVSDDIDNYISYLAGY